MRLDQNSFMEDNRGERFSPWTSYSDMFCSLMMLFVLLFVFIMLQYVSVKARDALQLAEANARIEDAEGQLALSATENDALRLALSDTESELKAANTALSETELELDAANTALTDTRAERDAANTALSRTEADLDSVRLALSETQAERDAANTALSQNEADLSAARLALSQTESDRDAARLALSQTEAERDAANTALSQTEAERDAAYTALSQTEAERDAAYTALSETEAERDAAYTALSETQAERDAANTALSQTQAELDAANVALANSDTDGLYTLLSEKEAELDAANARLSQVQDDLDALRADDSVGRLTERVSSLEQELADQQAAFQRVAGIRMEIIEEVSRALAEAGISTKVDESGSIVIGSEMLFSTNDSTLRPAGQAVLDEVFPVYFRVMTEGAYADSISQIIIEGHTDSRGSYLKNMALSSERAQSVLEYCYGLMAQDQQATFVEKVVATGCSFSRPILGENGQEDADRSRRVEIKFTLKDEMMIEQMQRIVGDQYE